MFDKAELDAICQLIAAGFEGLKRERLEAVIAEANATSLMTRLRRALAEDDVPCSEVEFELITRMRKARNDLVHGRPRDMPDAHEHDLAIAPLGRILAYRMRTSARS